MLKIYWKEKLEKVFAGLSSPKTGSENRANAGIDGFYFPALINGDKSIGAAWE